MSNEVFMTIMIIEILMVVQKSKRTVGTDVFSPSYKIFNSDLI